MTPDCPASAPLLVLDTVSRHFGGAGGVMALTGVSLTIHAGEMVAIMGASGSGKTTLMNILGCLDRPDGGRYLVDGQDVSRLDRDALARLRNRRFGFVFQRYNLLPGLTARENVEVPAVYAGRAARDRHRAAATLLDRLGLGARAGHRPNQMSGGQQQRVSIARALVNDAEIILADEPTGALDEASGAEVLALLKDLNREGRTVILITHDAAVAAHASRQIRMRDGRIVADSGVSASATDPLKADSPATEPPASTEPGMQRRPWFGLTDLGAAVRMALHALRVNLFRSLLTLLGVVIGVASVIAMLAIGDGSRAVTLERIATMGTNLLTVRGGAPGVRAVGDITSLTVEDVQAIRQIDGIVATAPERNLRTTLRVGGIDYTTMAQGVWPDALLVRNWQMARGQFISAADVYDYRSVLVLGDTVARNLFPDGSDPIGGYVLVRNIPFEVIGVLAAKGATQSGSDQDDVVLMPLSTGFLRILGRSHVSSVTVRVESADQVALVARQIDSLLLDRHRVRNFQIRDTAAVQAAMSDSQRSFALLLGAVAAISLLVGGIGVMNIMLVSVTERTREIGIRMATGARMRSILMQFNVEAVVVCGIGGVVGIGVGLPAALLLASAGFDVLITPAPALLAFGCAFLTGVVFGYLPARKAARMDPVIALAAE
ncbi:macrolide export ATP-binding/permease protein MacB [Tistrella bauzanensis]|uniref:Macrolide export ATP-binding/permease protein MacB n=1 Tax=Tistrella bauzanensis TaxID=657419 RepID=A0ABQ1I9X3_9PROT|nr:MacB family efflux pump subunit [Tistrella bauzanensis]GGB28471.1 macrolide export ATP-binding/permease protein MacB [Tistrella bauzanensis]